VQLAADAGADAVKFQTIVPTKLVSASDERRVEQLTKFQFSPEQFTQLAELAKSCGAAFMSTPFDLDAVEWLDPLVPAFKIASGDNDFLPLIDRVVQTGKPLVVSTGLGRLESAGQLVEFVKEAAKKHNVASIDLALLHCVASYPTPPEEAGLVGIRQLAELGVTPGYSDHTLGIRAVQLAVAAGARIVEKHFTINKNHSEFRDHQLSADPKELREMVNLIREIEGMFGDADRLIQNCETTNEIPLRRSIAAARDLKAGDTVAWEDLCWVRPQTGLKPGGESSVVDHRLKQDIATGEAFTTMHFE
jgi:sialic acid synthase SpsE